MKTKVVAGCALPSTSSGDWTPPGQARFAPDPSEGLTTATHDGSRCRFPKSPFFHPKCGLGGGLVVTVNYQRRHPQGDIPARVWDGARVCSSRLTIIGARLRNRSLQIAITEQRHALAMLCGKINVQNSPLTESPLFPAAVVSARAGPASGAMALLRRSTEPGLIEEKFS